ncbi:MAG: DUF4129 domain-containing protein [Chloroflexaceae bacterium]|nr:DUF4129 domain-containing protein [Chloroflexaceae bacterium]
MAHFSRSFIGWFAGLLFYAVLIFLGWLSWNGVKHWRQRQRLAKLPPMQRIYQQMLLILSVQGYPKHPAQTPGEYAQTARQHHPEPIAQGIEQISLAYAGWRYGEKSAELNQLQQQLRSLRQAFSSQGVARSTRGG